MPATESPVTHSSFSTRDPELGHATLVQRYGQHRMRLGGSPENYRLDLEFSGAGQVRMDRMRHSMTTTAIAEPFEYLLFLVVLDGMFEMRSARHDVRIGPRQSLLYDVGVPFEVHWVTIDLHLCSLSTAAVAELASERTGIPVTDFRFDSGVPASPALDRYWRANLSLVDRELRAPDSVIAEPLVQAGVVSMLAGAALAVFPNTAMSVERSARPQRVPPATLRRAVAFIDAHAGDPLTVTQIANASGVTARALQSAFRRHHDTSPLGYLRRVRLERAHRDLQSADPTAGASVASVAARWGFARPERFAAHYRREYGVRPSHTLRT